MSRLQPSSWAGLVRKLKALGFAGPFYRGKHPYMIRGTIRLKIPNPHRQDIGIDLLARILRQAEISREQWEDVN